MPTDLENLSDEELEKIAMPTSLPQTYDNPDLVPRLAKDPSRQLEEYRVRYAANMKGVDPHLAAGVAYQESGFNPNAVSPTGVKGTMQVQRNTANALGYNRDDPTENILAGVTKLKKDPLGTYPAPKDAGEWVPAVKSHAAKSRSMAPALDQLSDDELSKIAGEQPSVPDFHKEGEYPQPAELGANPQPIDFKKDLLNPAWAFLRKGTQSATAGLSEPVAAGLSTAATFDPWKNKISDIPDLYNKFRQNQRVSLTKLERENPYASGAGTITGLVAPNGAFNQLYKGAGALTGAVGKGLTNAAPILEKTPGIVSKLGNAGLTGGLANLGYETINPESTDTPLSSFEKGAEANIAGESVGSLLNKIGQMGAAIKYRDLGLGKKALETSGSVPMGEKGLLKTLQGNLKDQGAELDKILIRNADKEVPLPDNLTHGDLQEYAYKAMTNGDWDKAEKLQNATIAAKNNGVLSPRQAVDVKRALDDEAYSVSGGLLKNTEKAKALNQMRGELNGNIKTALGDSAKDYDQLNKQLGPGLKLQRVLKKDLPKSGLSKLDALGAMAAGYNPIHVGIPYLGFRSLVSTPGFTTAGALGALAPQVRALAPLIPGGIGLTN
jgi:hypothetical protein